MAQTERDRVIYGLYWDSGARPRPSDNALAMIDQMVRERRHRRPHLADLGCGTGRHALYAAGRGARVTAVDHSRSAVMALRDAAQGLDCQVIEGDAFSWLANQAPAALDAIVCFDVVHHASEDEADVEEIIRTMGSRLAPGGLLLITLLCDIRYSTGEAPPGRLALATERAPAMFARALPGHALLKEKYKPVYRPGSLSIDPSTNLVAESLYEAVRVMRVYRAP